MDVVAAFLALLAPTFPLGGSISQDFDATQSNVVVGDLDSARRSKVPKTTAGTTATGRQAKPKLGANANDGGRTPTFVLRVDRSTLNEHEYWNAHAGVAYSGGTVLAACTLSWGPLAAT